MSIRTTGWSGPDDIRKGPRIFFDNAIQDAVAKGFLLSGLGLFWIIFLVRIVGLRSLSKMTNFDFVMTVATGSLLAGASQSDEWSDLLQTLTAMASLFGVQYSVAAMRQRVLNTG